MNWNGKRRVHFSFFFAVALVASVAPLASGDTIVTNDVGTAGDAEKAVGDSGTARVYVVASNSAPAGDRNGCNAGGASQATTVTLQSSRPSKVAIASPGFLVFEGCDDAGTATVENARTLDYTVVGGAPGDVVVVYANATGGKSGSLYANGQFRVTVAAPVVTNTAPTTPGEPRLAAGSASPNQGQFALAWNASTDGEDDDVLYRLEHREAGSASYSPVAGASALADPTFAFASGNPEAEGNWTYRVNATDGALGSAWSDVSAVVVVDQSAPDLVVTGCPTASVLRNSAVSATYFAWDNRSGLAGGAFHETGTFLLPTGALGATTGSKTVTDNVGLQATQGCTYDVIGYTYAGFYSPISPDNATWNSVKAGATVPLKFNVAIGGEPQQGTTYGGQPIVALSSKKVACPGAAAEDPVDYVVNATGGTSLRYDPVAGQYVYNWKTPSTKGCYELALTGLDGSRLLARFSLR